MQLEEGNFKAQVELLSSKNDSATRSTIRQLKLTVGKASKTVWHYLFEGWPDFGIPEGEDRVALLELVKQTASKAAVKETSMSNAQTEAHNPRIVHCSAGVGRSGTFIALDYLLTELVEGALDDVKDEDDRIAECVDNLRSQRMMMVQGDVQFYFLYEVLKEQWIQRRAKLQE